MNVYSPDHGSLICPLKPNLGRISGGVQAVGFNWRSFFLLFNLILLLKKVFLGSIQRVAKIFWRIQKKYLQMDTSTLAKEKTLQVWDQSLQMIFQLLVSHVICSFVPTCTYLYSKPILGQSIVPNLYVITGHGSKGWTLSFGSSALLADIIDGKSTQVFYYISWINNQMFWRNFLYFRLMLHHTLHYVFILYETCSIKYSKVWPHLKWGFATFESTWCFQSLLICLA